MSGIFPLFIGSLFCLWSLVIDLLLAKLIGLFLSAQSGIIKGGILLIHYVFYVCWAHTFYLKKVHGDYDRYFGSKQ